MSIEQQTPPSVDRVIARRRRPAWVAVAVFVGVLVVGIGLALLAGLGSEPDVAEPSSTTTSLESLGPDARPATEVRAVLGGDPTTETYFVRGSGDFDAEAMGIDPGTVTAEWFRAEGVYVVFFAGLDPAATSDLCPSAAVFGEGSEDFMANAPAGDADCSSIVINELSDPAVRTLTCDGGLAFRTAIPDDRSGTLVASLEKQVVDPFGATGIMGMSSSAEAASGTIPEVDLALFDC